MPKLLSAKTIQWLSPSCHPLGCTALQVLALGGNELMGGLEPLQGCTAPQKLRLQNNRLTGGLEPLRGCTALQSLYLKNSQLVPSEEDKEQFQQQCEEFFI